MTQKQQSTYNQDLFTLQVNSTNQGGDIKKLQKDMTKVLKLVEGMSEKMDWFYGREKNAEEQGLIHDNAHEEITETLIVHEKRIGAVETFVKVVSA